MWSFRQMRAPRPLALGGAMLLLALLAPSAASAAGAPSAAWQILQSTTPTNLLPGSEAAAGSGAQGSAPKYRVTVTNVGGAEAVPNVTITDTLPPGITVPLGAEPAVVAFNVNTTALETTLCAVAGQTVSCEVPFALPPNGSATAYIPIEVGGSGEFSNIAQVSSPETRSVTSEFATTVSGSLPSFSFAPGPIGLGAEAFDAAGEPPTAGSHPFTLWVQADTPNLNADGLFGPLDPLRSLNFTLPSGLVVNPTATAVRCTRTQFEGATRYPPRACPVESQVGTLLLDIPGFEPEVALFNLVPEPDAPAELGFQILNTQVRLRGGLDGNYHLTAAGTELLSKFKIAGARVQLWGDPSGSEHDFSRGEYGTGCEVGVRCPVTRTGRAFLTMPSACSNSLPIAATATGWLGSSVSEERVFTTAAGQPESVTGCDRLTFEPTVSIRPESKTAETPAGLDVSINVPQNEGSHGLAAATLKKVVVQLPPGMTVNPPAANGLGACSPAQIGIGNTLSAKCPTNAKVGVAEISTPLLAHSLTGSIYLAEEHNNPFGTLLALYLVVEGEGVMIKLPGRIDADRETGQLTATFDNNPQLPFEELSVQFSGGNGGPRATLVTPPSCGTYTARTELTSWASSTPTVINSAVVVNQGCSTGGFKPGLEAGTENPVGGRYSSFMLRVTRSDGEQNLSRVEATLPEGLLAKLSGVPLCQDAQAAVGACPSTTQVGTTTVGAGAGALPIYVPQPGKAPTAVYLAGPYRGAPYSLVVKAPAQAGPFDLGTVVTRVALNVDLFTTRVTASSDPLPQILEGIPVAYRDLRVNVDRPEFILNPTSCNPMTIESSIISSSGAIAHPSNRFQVAGCQSLAFKPSLKLSLKGGTKRSGHPALKAVVTYPKQGAYANIVRAQVGLPHSEFLDQGNLNKVCTQPQLKTASCPKSSIYGHAKAWTPLLDKPLEGPVYLGVGFGYKLPALVAELNGQIRILLKGKIDTTKHAGLRNTFEAVPDAPVEKFVLEMKGGKKYGLLENSENICRKTQKAAASFTAQNGRVEQLQPRIANDCKGGKQGKKKAGKGKKHH
ncbi:MAG: isopeptide-forming domain-containing fimbrial protein [Actinobacteria bacterium]|nr:isopeptide-forming domain-containing fimbrial protein [Actinomycetota bacterium]